MRLMDRQADIIVRSNLRDSVRERERENVRETQWNIGRFREKERKICC